MGDVILNGIIYKSLFRNDDIVKVRPRPGATSEDLIYYIKPVVRRKPHIAVLHAGNNDLTSGINTQDRMEEVVDMLYRESKGAKIVLSPVAMRNDKSHLQSKVSTLNRSIKTF